ncbi:MAG: hypothetical protein A2W00_07335 [Candidatus Eisenbacteria bacterium RBG_16_71_46]|nr:MAG: hypothetical protein A2W00_07335 [Candidatus Eisenbacteria bacterium RBG_16_71_46]
MTTKRQNARRGHIATWPLLLVAACVLASGNPANSATNDGAWTSLSPFGPRLGHSAICDPVRDRVIVFAGSGANDLWSLALSGTPAWTRLAAGGTPPTARQFHSAIYDERRDRMIVFGGSGLNDLWELSLAGTPAWNRIVPSGTQPSGRYGHTAIYDPVRDRMIVFGGYASWTINDVWALSLSGAPAWTQLVPTGTAPAARHSHAALYDPVRDRMLVLGGRSGGGDLYGDVWALSLGGTPAWNPVTVPGTPPAARYNHSAIYDAARDRLVMFGGDLTPTSNYDQHSDELWTLSLAGTPAWAQVPRAGAWPGPRAEHTAIRDVARDRMVVFAGNGGNTLVYDDTWSLPLAGAPAWTQLEPEGAPPNPRVGHAAVFDALRRRMVVFGGSGRDDAWSLGVAPAPIWTRLSPTGTPPSGRDGHTAILDPVGDRMIVFGGAGLNDLWALALSGGTAWTQLTPLGTLPPGRSDHSAIYDPVRRRMIVFGGSGLNDVWELTLSGPLAWNEIVPSGTAPSGRGGHAAIYDPAGDRMIVYGGSGDEVWELTLGAAPAWRQLFPSGAPPGSLPGSTAIYDPARGRIVIFGGGNFVWITGDAWALELTNPPAWSKLSPVGDGGRRSGHTAVYDPLGDQMVVFGGERWSCAACYTLLDDARALVWESPTPVLASLVSAEAEPGRVRLTWHTSDPAGAVAQVWRCPSGAGWARIGDVVPDGSGLMHYEDLTVLAGQRYGYRLALREAAGETLAGETWVEVPRWALSLLAVRPNPSRVDNLAVDLVLPGFGPARVELVDVGGRRVAAREVGWLGPGPHAVSLGAARRLSPGIYFVRLIRSGEVRSARATVLP